MMIPKIPLPGREGGTSVLCADAGMGAWIGIPAQFFAVVPEAAPKSGTLGRGGQDTAVECGLGSKRLRNISTSVAIQNCTSPLMMTSRGTPEV